MVKLKVKQAFYGYPRESSEEESAVFYNSIYKGLLNALVNEIEKSGYAKLYKEVNFADEPEHPGSLVSCTASVNYAVSVDLMTTEDKIELEAMKRVISKLPYGDVAVRAEMDNIKGERREW